MDRGVLAHFLMEVSLDSWGCIMESKAKLFGHAIHPILIVYPLGLLSAAVVFDVIYLVTGNTTWTTVSYWMIAAGIVGGLLAAVFGLIDFLNIPSGTRAKRVGLLHGLVNLGVMILFIASWLLRMNYPEVPSTAAFALSFIGVGAASLGGWLGGELVERLGVGVASDANLNAPNSLTAGPSYAARQPAEPRYSTK